MVVSLEMQKRLGLIKNNTTNKTATVAERLMQQKSNISNKTAEEIKPEVKEKKKENKIKLFNDLTQRYKNLQEIKTERERGNIGFLSSKLQQTGEAAGAINDVIGASLRVGAKVLGSVTPSFIKEPIKNLATGALEGAASTEIVKKAVQSWNSFQENYPNVAKNVSAIGNIATLIPITKGTSIGAKAVEKQLIKNTEKKAPKVINKTIEYNIEKAIRPSVIGKTSLAQKEKYLNDAKDAVKLIIDNKPNLQFISETGENITNKLPSSLKELSQAIDQTKANIFKEYDTLAKNAGQVGLKIDLTRPASALKEIITDPVLHDLRPEIVNYAKEKATSLMSRGTYTAEETQKAIKIANQSLENFYKNPDILNGARAMVDSMIANNLRKSLDEGIESVVNFGYQKLKNQYGSLKNIEKDVLKRAIVNERKNVKGLIDFTDIFSSGDVINGLLSFNPSLITKGFAQKGLASLYKKWNDPDNIIKKMFEKVDKLYKKSPKVMPKEFKPAGLLGSGAIRLPSSGSPKSETMFLK